MLLRAVEIMNIKSYYPEKRIVFDAKQNINIYVGPNSSGKSNLFEVLQGSINDLFFLHISVEPNSERMDKTKPSYRKNFTIRPTTLDEVSFSRDIFDKHFNHLGEPSYVRLCWGVTSKDISFIHRIIKQKDDLLTFFQDQVADYSDFGGTIARINSEHDYSFLKGREIEIEFSDTSRDASIKNLEAYDENDRIKVVEFVTLIRHANALYELSSVYPKIKASPQSRYIGPHRESGAINQSNFVDLGTSNYEDVYSKVINSNRDNSGGFVSQSPNKLALLKYTKQTKTLSEYNKYLEKYLKAHAKVEKNDIPFRHEYLVDFDRLNGNPMKLSSGEREFFNLISGLILSQIRNGIVFIDEPEIHLHFKWQGVIVELISELSVQFNLQFFIVTHSPKFITPETAKYINRVAIKDGVSVIAEPNQEMLQSARLKDLLAFLSITNNEKVFFCDKVILVEGTSDLLVYDTVLKKIVEDVGYEGEVEIVPVFGKNNLYNYREILKAWNISCYIIGDTDFLNEVLKYSLKKSLITSEESSQLKNETKKLFPVSRAKLKAVLDESNEDGVKFIDILLNRESIEDEEFLESMDSLIEYLFEERAVQSQKNYQIPEIVETFIDRIYDEDKVYVLKKGALENYFLRYDKDKINNAEQIIKNFTKQIEEIDEELVGIFKLIIESDA